MWARYDHNGTGFMKIADFPKMMFQLGDPLGWD